MVKWISHRGESADAPENTLPAFKLALERNTDGFETDIHLTADKRRDHSLRHVPGQAGRFNRVGNTTVPPDTENALLPDPASDRGQHTGLSEKGNMAGLPLQLRLCRSGDILLGLLVQTQSENSRLLESEKCHFQNRDQC